MWSLIETAFCLPHDLRMFHEMKSFHDSQLLQADVTCVCGRCVADRMGHSANTTRVYLIV
jgi:hypothetical protein